MPRVEEIHLSSGPRETVAENARRKMAWAGKRFPARTIVTADTLVELEGEPVAKPTSLTQAADFFRAFSGKAQTVWTGVALYAGDGDPETAVAQSIVRFKTIDDAVIRGYFDCVFPLDKAGGYDINQRASLIIEGFEGSKSNIMGLPMEIVAPWLRTHGWPVTEP